MKYTELKRKHQNELNSFPIKFAFSKIQFEEVIKELGEDLIKVPHGGFIRTSDKKSFLDMLIRQGVEMSKAFEDDDFLTDAIEYELTNHEFIVTYDPEPAISALGLSLEDERVNNLFQIARRRHLEYNS